MNPPDADQRTEAPFAFATQLFYPCAQASAFLYNGGAYRQIFTLAVMIYHSFYDG